MTTDPERPAIAGDDAILIHENLRERIFPVDSNFDGWRLDRFLANRLHRLSRDRANQIAKRGDITILPSQRKAKPSMKLQAGESVVLREEMAPEWVQDAQVEILYADDDLFIVNKPSGMLVHESTSVRLNTIQWFLVRHGEPEVQFVHRLDRETSGVLVCARTPERVAQLNELFTTAHPEKVYRAMVLDPHGVWTPGAERTLSQPLGMSLGTDLELRMTHGDLRSVTHVTALAVHEHPRFGRMVDVCVRIETGRQHQIRVHLEMAGTPIAGDKLYGKSNAFFMAACDNPDDPKVLSQLAYPRHALHAWKMTLPHPRTHKPISFTAPLPASIWSFTPR